MNWILLPILAAIGYALSRFIENYLADTAFTKKNVSALSLICIGSYAIVIITLIAVFGIQVFSLDFVTIIGMLLAGVVNGLAEIPYCKALKKADTFDVTVLEQSAPIISLVLGFLILGQMISSQQLIGFILMMMAMIMLVLGERAKKLKELKFQAAGHVFLACLLWVVSDIVLTAFTKASDTVDYLYFGKTLMYYEIGSLLVTLIIGYFKTDWTKELKRVFLRSKKKSSNILAAFADCAIYSCAEILNKLALIIAPAVALVSIIDQVSGLIAAFFLGIILSVLWPNFGRENLSKKIIFRHLIAAFFVGAGIVLIG